MPDLISFHQESITAHRLVTVCHKRLGPILGTVISIDLIENGNCLSPSNKSILIMDFGMGPKRSCQNQLVTNGCVAILSLW